MLERDQLLHLRHRLGFVRSLLGHQYYLSGHREHIDEHIDYLSPPHSLQSSNVSRASRPIEEVRGHVSRAVSLNLGRLLSRLLPSDYRAIRNLQLQLCRCLYLSRNRLKCCQSDPTDHGIYHYAQIKWANTQDSKQ